MICRDLDDLQGFGLLNCHCPVMRATTVANEQGINMAAATQLSPTKSSEPKQLTAPNGNFLSIAPADSAQHRPDDSIAAASMFAASP